MKLSAQLLSLAVLALGHSAFAASTSYSCNLVSVRPAGRPASAQQINVTLKDSGKFSFSGVASDGSSFNCTGKMDRQSGDMKYGMVAIDRDGCYAFGGASSLGTSQGGADRASFVLNMSFQEYGFDCTKTSSSWF